MRRGTLITIIVLFVLLAVFAVLQIGGLTSQQRPRPPTPSATQS